MENQSKDDRKQADANRGPKRGNPGLWIVAATVVLLLFLMMTMARDQPFTLERYEYFLQLIRDGEVISLKLKERQATGVLKNERDAPDVRDPVTGKMEPQTKN